MRKNGTCKTSLATKSKPLTRVSSQVTALKSIKNESTHSVTFTDMIYLGIGRVSLWSIASILRVGECLTGTSTKILMTIPAATAIAACL